MTEKLNDASKSDNVQKGHLQFTENCGDEQEENEYNRRMFEESQAYPITSAAELEQMELSEQCNIIPGLLTEGLGMLTGKPKIGKSWLALQFACAVTRGGETIIGVKANQSDVLMLTLEDSRRRIKDRLSTVKGEYVPEKLYFAERVPPMNAGGYEWLVNRIEQYPGVKLIIIDTMGRFVHFDGKRGDAYTETTIVLSKLQKLAMENHIMILLIHHQKKDSSSEDPFDSILGSTAIRGVLDVNLLVQKKSDRIELLAEGRDIDSKSWIIEFDNDRCKWKLVGDSTEIRLSDQKKKILEVFDDGEALTPSEIAQKSTINHSTVRGTCRKLVTDGLLIEAGNGRYMKSTMKQ